MRIRNAFILGITASMLLQGCSLLRKPDMTRISGIAELKEPQRPLIFIPGFLGTKLRDPETDKVVWGSMTNVLMGGDSDDLALAMRSQQADDPMGERVEPYAIYDSLWGIEYYRKILRTLRSAGGYRIGDIDNPRPGDNAFVFIYDWRRDNVESAARLSKAIQKLKRRMGDDTLRFDLLAHSQGGLIARYYIKYGDAPLPQPPERPRPSMAGAGNVGRLIMLGTPNRGCLEAMKILHVGVKKVFRPIRPEVVFTMPSVYQMLPPRGSLLFADTAGEPVDLDIYDAGVWRREGWSVFAPEARKRMEKGLRRAGATVTIETLAEEHFRFLQQELDRAHHFHEALDARVWGHDVTYHAFGSDCNPTLKTVVLVEEGEDRRPVFDIAQLKSGATGRNLGELIYGAGDGTVLMQSLLAISDGEEEALDISSAFFFCGDHGVLANNPIFQNNLFYVLLWDDTPGSSPAGQVTGASRSSVQESGTMFAAPRND